jgi:hypothetical protein
MKQEVTGPDIRSVIAAKCAPLLTSWLVGANRPHVLLDGALTHVYPQFQQFPANALSSPSRFSFAICLINAMVCGATFGV